jgi:tetratricopeptide (TPR) repeat protein
LLNAQVASWHFVVARYRGEVKLHHSQIEEALADINKALELDPQNSSAYRVRAEVMLNTREFAAAMRDLDKALEINPTEMAILRVRGELFFELGDYHKALVDLQAADRCIRNHEHTLRYVCLHTKEQLYLGLATFKFWFQCGVLQFTPSVS